MQRPEEHPASCAESVAAATPLRQKTDITAWLMANSQGCKGSTPERMQEQVEAHENASNDLQCAQEAKFAKDLAA